MHSVLASSLPAPRDRRSKSTRRPAACSLLNAFQRPRNLVPVESGSAYAYSRAFSFLSPQPLHQQAPCRSSPFDPRHIYVTAGGLYYNVEPLLGVPLHGPR